VRYWLPRYKRQFSSPLREAVIVENFSYRQMNNLWRVQGYWQFIRGRTDWAMVARKGFKKKR